MLDFPLKHVPSKSWVYICVFAETSKQKVHIQRFQRFYVEDLCGSIHGIEFIVHRKVM
jgi:hypothetical protein